MKKLILAALFTLSFTASADELATVYRFSNGFDYWYTTNYNEGLRRIGYNYDAIAFRVFTESHPNSRYFAFFQCRFRQVNGHFISNYQNCEGHINEGLIGFAPEQQFGGMVSVYRCDSPTIAGSVMTTIDTMECSRRRLRYNSTLYGLVYR